MGVGNSKYELSLLQKKKLVFEFRTFFDLNKDGCLEWKDFNLAREDICKKSGWKPGTPKYVAANELFEDMWGYLQDVADENTDGSITEAEWLEMWTSIERGALDHEVAQQKLPEEERVPLELPAWIDKYILYKFNLLDRTGDGQIDVEEFEYVLSWFNVSAKDCRACFIMFSEANSRRVDLAYFRELALQYFRSNDVGALGNFINGKLVWDDEMEGVTEDKK